GGIERATEVLALLREAVVHRRVDGLARPPLARRLRLRLAEPGREPLDLGRALLRRGVAVVANRAARRLRLREGPREARPPPPRPRPRAPRRRSPPRPGGRAAGARARRRAARSPPPPARAWLPPAAQRPGLRAGSPRRPRPHAGGPPRAARARAARAPHPP